MRFISRNTCGSFEIRVPKRPIIREANPTTVVDIPMVHDNNRRIVGSAASKSNLVIVVVDLVLLLVLSCSLLVLVLVLVSVFSFTTVAVSMKVGRNACASEEPTSPSVKQTIPTAKRPVCAAASARPNDAAVAVQELCQPTLTEVTYKNGTKETICFKTSIVLVVVVEVAVATVVIDVSSETSDDNEDDLVVLLLLLFFRMMAIHDAKNVLYMVVDK